MGSEALWVPAVLAAAGAGTDYVAQRGAQNQRNDLALRGLKKQEGHQRNINAAVDQQLGALKESSPEAARQKAMSDYIGQLRAARSQARGPSTPGGGRYQADTEGSEAAIQNFGEDRADMLSRISSAGTQRRDEAIGIGKLGGQIGTTANIARGDQALTDMKVAGVQENPWLKGLALALKAAGMAYGVAGAGGAAGSASGAAGTGGGSGVANMGSGVTNFGAASRYVPLAR